MSNRDDLQFVRDCFLPCWVETSRRARQDSVHMLLKHRTLKASPARFGYVIEVRPKSCQNNCWIASSQLRSRMKLISLTIERNSRWQRERLMPVDPIQLIRISRKLLWIAKRIGARAFMNTKQTTLVSYSLDILHSRSNDFSIGVIISCVRFEEARGFRRWSHYLTGKLLITTDRKNTSRMITLSRGPNFSRTCPFFAKRH